MKEVLDLSELLGLVRLDDFEAQLEKVDFARYEGKKVQMRGCVPVWAHDHAVGGRAFAQWDFAYIPGLWI